VLTPGNKGAHVELSEVPTAGARFWIRKQSRCWDWGSISGNALTERRIARVGRRHSGVGAQNHHVICPLIAWWG